MMNPLDLTILITIKMNSKSCELVFGKHFKKKIIVDYAADSQVYVGTSLQGPASANRWSPWFCRFYSVLFLYLIELSLWVSRKKKSFLSSDNWQQRLQTRGDSQPVTHGCLQRAEGLMMWLRVQPGTPNIPKGMQMVISSPAAFKFAVG